MTLQGGSIAGSYFLCQWDASLGQATVPQAVLGGLAGQSSGYLVYGQYTSTAFTSGSYSNLAARAALHRSERELRVTCSEAASRAREPRAL